MKKCTYEAWGEYKCDIKEGYEQRYTCNVLKDTLSDLKVECPNGKKFKDNNTFDKNNLNDVNKILNSCCGEISYESCKKFDEAGYICDRGSDLDISNKCRGEKCNSEDKDVCCKRTEKCINKEKEFIKLAHEIGKTCNNYSPEIKQMLGSCSNFPGTCPENTYIDSSELCMAKECTLKDKNICCRSNKKGLCYEGVNGECNDNFGNGLTKEQCLSLEANKNLTNEEQEKVFELHKRCPSKSKTLSRALPTKPPTKPPTIFNMEQKTLQDKIKEEESNLSKLVCIHLDCDDEENEDILEDWKVESLPTQIFVHINENNVVKDEKIEGYDWIKLKMYYDKIIEN